MEACCGTSGGGHDVAGFGREVFRRKAVRVRSLTVAVPIGLGAAQEGAGGAAGGFAEAVAGEGGLEVWGGDAVGFVGDVTHRDHAEGVEGLLVVERLEEAGAAGGEAFEAVERGLGFGGIEEGEEGIDREFVVFGEVGEGEFGAGEVEDEVAAAGGGELWWGGGRGVSGLDREVGEFEDGQGDGLGGDGHVGSLYRGERGRVCAHGEVGVARESCG